MTKNIMTQKKNILILIGIVILAALIFIISLNSNNINSNDSQESTSARNGAENQNKPLISLDNDLAITKIGSYSGPYMEDASDEKVADVLAIYVTNNSESALQYAEITLTGESGEAIFKLSTLNPGETTMVLEANRKIYTEGDTYTKASTQYVVFFEEALTTYEDKLQIQPLDGGFNITNISEKDIEGEIMVYFKDYQNGILYGGITYRGRIEGGLKSGEIRQIMTDNFTESNTKVMFITITDTEQ